MKSKKTAPAAKDVSSSRVPLFERTNLLWMLGGVAIMILGFILMAGGKSEDPNVFNPDEVYSTMRITVAPILILAGLVVLIYAIFRHPKAD